MENVNCNTKEELRKIEDNYIKDALLNNPSCCNTYRAILTAEELKECKIRSIKSYNAINRELINNKRRNYYYKHREVIIQKQKEYAEIHTVHIKEYCKKYHKTYAKVNKEKIKQKRAELTTCTCGCTMQKYDINKHLNTNKHKKLMLQVNTQK